MVRVHIDRVACFDIASETDRFSFADLAKIRLN